MNKVFLGGTCANSTWRAELIKLIQVDFFNPVVEDWNSDCQAIEEVQKEVDCNIHLYVITKEMLGVYSIAEVVESCFNKTKSTILHILPEGFDTAQLKSLNGVCDLIRRNGGIAYIDEELTRTARVLNCCFK